MSEEKKNKGWEKSLEEEAPPSEQELQQAQQLGAQVDALLDGERPPQGSRELHAAAMVHAAMSDQPLESSRRDQLVQEALDQRSGGRAPGQSPQQASAPGVDREGSPSSRFRRWAPALALAASVLLGLSVILQLSPRRASRRQPLPIQLTSRTSDALIGRPIEDRAGASGRLDLVFADRMGGYRKVMLGSRETL